MTKHPCAQDPNRYHDDGPCQCFRGGPAPARPGLCPTCGIPWVVDSLRRDCVDHGHVTEEASR